MSTFKKANKTCLISFLNYFCVMKNLIQKEQVNKAGIYKITNVINGKYYLGSSKNISSRYRSHLCTLKNNKSGCRLLQNAVIKYGLINFVFEVIEICENYQEIECILLKELNPKYNIIQETGEKRILSKETRKRMSESKKGIPSPFKGVLNPNYIRNKKKIVLYKNLEYTIENLASELKVSVQAIYQRIKRGTLKLKT